MLSSRFSQIFLILSFLILEVYCDTTARDYGDYYGPSMGLIIGLSVGLPLLMFIFIMACACYQQRRNRRQVPTGQIISAQPVMAPPRTMYHAGPMYTQQTGMYPQGNVNYSGGFLPSNPYPAGTEYIQNGAQFPQGTPNGNMGPMNYQPPPPYGINLPQGNVTNHQETPGKP